jgi:hypothetical protein
MVNLHRLVVRIARVALRTAGPVSLAAVVALAGGPAHAQTAPKITNLYKDEVGLGFTIKAPDWGFVPAQSHEVNTIGKYSNGRDNYIIDYKANAMVDEARVELLKFDRRTKADAAAEDASGSRRPVPVGQATFAEYAKEALGDWKEVERKPVKVDGLAATRILLKRLVGSKDEGIEIAALVYVYPLSADVDVAMLGIGPGDKKKWGKWEGVYDTAGKSLKRVELSAKAIGTGPRSSAPRDEKRYRLEQEVAKNPGWKMFESPNYFVITSKTDDKEFIDELMTRLEAIREVYEEIYPVSLINELRLLAAARKKAEAEANPAANGGAKEGEEPVPEPERRTVAGSADPMEASRCSVVRICKDKNEYHTYGGPQGSAGYWSSFHEELVIYDDQASGGRRNTWATLNHEAFHQYIFYFLGNFAPHSWYNEGNGDFFSGFQITNRKFKLRPFDWRLGLAKENIKKSEKDIGVGVVPLKEIVRWTQAQYYGGSKYQTDGGDHYAQGWSFVYFLRTGKGNSKCWEPAYDNVLSTYLRTLVETDDLNKAVDAAFAGIDFDKLEACWKEYTLSL